MPDHVRPGVLPRKTEFGKLKTLTYPKGIPVFSDVCPTVPKRDWAELIAAADKPECSSAVWNTYDQDGVRSCASEAANKSNEIIRALSGRDPVQFNPWFTYYKVSGGRDGGSSLDDNVEQLIEVGSCPESVYPRSKGWRKKPPEEAYEAAANYRVLEIFDIETTKSQFTLQFGSALLLGYPVYFGYPLHAIVATELITPTRIRYKNSWGDWGEDGFGELDLDEAVMSYGAFAFRVSSEAAA
jgi:hypothetical protein